MVDEVRLRRAVDKALVKQSFMTLATVSGSQHPHAAGVLSDIVDGHLYVNTNVHSRKARNIIGHAEVAVCIPVRRLPVGPPSTIIFQASAEVLGRDDEGLGELLGSGRLKRITSHGELDDPDNWLVKITPRGRLHTFGLGVPLRTLARHPLETIGALEWS